MPDPLESPVFLVLLATGLGFLSAVAAFQTVRKVEATPEEDRPRISRRRLIASLAIWPVMILLSIRDGEFQLAALITVVLAGFPLGYSYWWIREGRHPAKPTRPL